MLSLSFSKRRMSLNKLLECLKYPLPHLSKTHYSSPAKLKWKQKNLSSKNRTKKSFIKHLEISRSQHDPINRNEEWSWVTCFFLYSKFVRVTKPVAWSFPNESQSRLWPQTAPTPLRTGRGVLRLPSYHMVITAMIYDTCKRSNLKLRISKQNMKYCPHSFGEVDNLLYLWLLFIPRNVSVSKIEKKMRVWTI